MTDDAANYRRIPLEVFNEGKVELIDELLSEDFIENLPLPPGFPTGRASLAPFVMALRTAFPDFRYAITGQWQDGDTHIGLIRASGTMTGEFMGMPPRTSPRRGTRSTSGATPMASWLNTGPSLTSWAC